ncbi:ARM repeat-containing protein [Trichodelitschia bisporula]|uniref:ARM repeat-containing protein n=1 Tax=Trichodelitschia bisporula TaxID=703511 RepID=A0A6G1HXJ2_9PEZI|nr:ARM repeat-containing protein [Trichodelitschia bisporula]
MPAETRTRQSGAVEMMEEEEESVATLQFSEAIAWRAGRPIAVATLLQRLDSLTRELQSYEQDGVDRDSLLGVAKDLASPSLLSHKDRGVRAYAACCLVDIFRLCAPDAPYTATQLRDIFTLFVSTIFPALSDPSNPYNGQHLFVLRSLAEVKSIVLLTDIPSSGNLIENLFTACFDVLSGPSKADSGEELSKNVEHHMTAVLATLVDESQSLPDGVIYTILAQFLRADPSVSLTAQKGKKPLPQIDPTQTTLLIKEAPPAYNMAKNICNSCPDKMSRYVTRYFSSVMLDAASFVDGRRKGRRGEDDEDEEPETSEDDLQKSSKAHGMLRELWRSTPSVLQDIVPQLEAELSAEHLNIRIMAVETVGDMIAGIGHAGPPHPTPLNPAAYPSQSLGGSDKPQVYNFLTTPSSPVSFISRYHQTYQAFVQRRKDKSPLVRAAWCTAVGRIVQTSAGGVGLDPDEEQTLLKYFAEALVDGDEKVRLSAVKAIERFDFNGILQKLGSNGGIGEPHSVLSNLADRVKDRKHHVRTEAIRLLGNVWGVAAGAIAEGSERVRTLLGQIPSRILDTYYINDAEINALVDHVLHESLIPLGYPPIKKPANGAAKGDEINADKIRTERILVMVRDLDQRASVVLFAMQAKQNANANYMNIFLQKCELYNGGVVDSGEEEIVAHLGKLIHHFTKTLPEPSRAAEDLWKFAKMHDRRSYQLIRFCTAVDSDYRKVQKAIKELTRRVEETAGGTATFVQTILILVYRCSVLFYNRSHIPAIIEYSRTDEQGLGKTAHSVLKEISKSKSEVFKAHIQDLCKSLAAEAPSAKKPATPGALSDLKACASFAQRFPADTPKDRKFLQAMLAYIEHGSPPKAAKYAVRIVLTAADRKEMYAKDVYSLCMDNFEYGAGNYLARLAALSQLMLLASPLLNPSECDSVIDVAIEKVLTNPDASPAAEDADPEWTDEPDEHCEAKMWALKLSANRLRSFQEKDPIDEASRPVFRFLNTLVQKGGNLPRLPEAPKAHGSRLRLLAAQLLLKICREERFNHRLSPTAFNNLATVTMDTNEHVRAGFVNKLMKYLGQGKLAKRFYTPLFLLAHEPRAFLQSSALTWLKSRSLAFAAAKDTTMEALFPRLLSLLAHHPDWDVIAENQTDEEERTAELIATMREFVQYIVFYLKCVASANNLSLVFHVAQKVKSVQDAINPALSDRLYLLSELAQEVIRRYEEILGWSMQAWPGKVSMPGGIFQALRDHDRAQEVATRQYVPSELVDQLDELVRATLRPKKRKLDASDRSAKKRKTTTTPARVKAQPSARKPKRVRTPKPKKRREGDEPSSEPRRSVRAKGRKSYVEISDEESVTAEGEDESDESEAQSDAESGAANSDGDEEISEAEEPEEPAEPVVEKKTKPIPKSTKKPAPPPAADDSDTSDLSEPVDSDEESPEPVSSPIQKRGAAKARSGSAAKGKNGIKTVPVLSSSPVATTPARATRRSARG